MKFSVLIGILLTFSTSYGATVAVIDSGLDVEHGELAGQIWENQAELNGIEGVDDDGNGLVDDIYGYNFEIDSNELIDPKKKDDFIPEDNEYFALQNRVIRTKAGLDNLSEEEIKRFGFDRRVGHAYDFAHVAHGTHVAGIVARDNPNVKVMGIKKGNRTVNITKYVKQIQSYNLTNVAKGDAEDLRETVDYLAQNEVRVANGSFGTPYEAIINRFYIMRNYGHPMAEIKYMAKLYQKALLKEQERTLQASPNTLFVFAAGNSGYNNDQHIFTPANVDVENAMTVAATVDRVSMPRFSCYGANTVHVAAPGVGIFSTVPGSQMMYMTGTSQAAPYVTRVASLIIDANPALTSGMVKRIIMETVDKKDFLRGKVISEGIVNDERAIKAAELTKETSIEEAIHVAKLMIPDMI